MQNNNGRFLDGFMIGALIGGTAIFLLGTKKGNKVLKVLSEGGIEGLTEMLTDFEEGVEEGIKTTKHDIVEKEEKNIRKIEERIMGEQSNSNENHSSGNKRFFRRSKA